MKKFIKNKFKYLIISLWSMLNALMWLAMRVNYAGISKALGADNLCKQYGIDEINYPTQFSTWIVMYLPVIFCVLFFIVFLYSILNTFVFKKRNKAKLISNIIINFIFTALIIVVIMLGSKDYLFVIMPKFYKSLLVACGIIVLALLLFFPIEGKRSVFIKISILVLVTALSVVIGYGLKTNYFTYEPVVYAVEDEYQIVFSTNDNSIARVKIGNNTYYDTYAGSEKSVDLVHKVIVPQSILDNAGTYTITAAQLNYRGPFGAFYGKTIEKTYSFKAPDASDGIDYYCVSDVHESLSAAVSAYEKAKAKTTNGYDFMVINGDTVSDVEYFENANLVNKLAFDATKGEIPVIYARGNHEVKGTYSEQLYKFVGSKDQKFYYDVTLDNGAIHAIVLDLGEDHDPGYDWWEYYDTDRFDAYRQEQIDWLNTKSSLLMQASYNMVICHIPFCYVNSRGDHTEWTQQICDILNDLPIDIALYAHKHELTPYVPGDSTGHDNYYLLDYNFYGFMVGRSSNIAEGDEKPHGTTEYTGLLVHSQRSSDLLSLLKYDNKVQWSNALGETVTGYCSWHANDEHIQIYQYQSRNN